MTIDMDPHIEYGWSAAQIRYLTGLPHSKLSQWSSTKGFVTGTRHGRDAYFTTEEATVIHLMALLVDAGFGSKAAHDAARYAFAKGPKGVSIVQPNHFLPNEEVMSDDPRLAALPKDRWEWTIRLTDHLTITITTASPRFPLARARSSD